MTTTPNAAILRGVDALDFDISANPGEPPQLTAHRARPPIDAKGYEAMVAASQLSAVCRLGEGPLAIPQVVYLADLHRAARQATRADQAEILRRYREALGDALEAYLADDEASRMKELLDWYKSVQRSADG